MTRSRSIVLAVALRWLFMLVAFGVLLFLRILNEEQVLRRDLEGYSEYCEKVRYRLVPGVW